MEQQLEKVFLALEKAWHRGLDLRAEILRGFMLQITLYKDDRRIDGLVSLHQVKQFRGHCLVTLEIERLERRLHHATATRA